MSERSYDQNHHYVVISSDCHAGADLLGYKPYLAKKWHEEFDEWAAAYTNPWDFVDPRLASEGFNAKDAEILTGAASWHSSLNWDSGRRLKDLECDGVVAEVIFPNTAPPFMPGSVLSGKGPATRDEYEHRWAGLQAHNRWLADFCADAPGRRAGIAQVLFDDLDDAVAEVREIKRLGLTGGILLPMDGPLGGTISLSSPDLEPLWQVCAELDVPVHKHSSAPPEQPGVAGSGRGNVAIGFAERQFFNHRCVAQLIFSGVLERHPTLKVVLSESGSGWVPNHLAMLDSIYRNGQDPSGLFAFLTPSLEGLTLSPSEYFARNFFLGASLFTPGEAASRHEIGVDRIMWGVDYPHAEGTFPYSRTAMSLVLADVPPHEVADILGLTAARVFDFDVAQLTEVANRVGPTVVGVATAPARLPTVPGESLSPVFSVGVLADR
jgi:predicted TIM-barrel fold metal-dependent hydrolase